MAITKVGANVTGFIAVGTGTETPSLPSGLAQGDVVIVAIACDNAINSLAGGIQTSMGYTYIHEPTVNNPGYQLAYKVMGATPDTTVTMEQEVGRRQAYVIQAWRGVDVTEGPLDVATPSVATGTTGDPDSPSITPVTSGALVFTVGFQDDDDSTVTTVPSGYSNSASSNTGQSSTTVGATVVIASKSWTSGAENPAAWALSGSDEWVGSTIALRPLITAAWDQKSFRWRNDDGTEATATWMAAENSNPAAQTPGGVLRLRFEVEETAVASPSGTLTAQLQYNKNSAGWNNVTNASSVARSIASQLVDSAATTEQMATSAKTFQSGEQEDVNGVCDAIAGLRNEVTEVEFSFEIRAADVVNDDTIQFRVINSTTALDAYTNTPTLTVSEGGSAAVTGTATTGITETDVVNGSKTIIITLTGDTWIAAGAGSFDLQRDEIIAGIDSAQSETFGWDLVPKALQSLGGVVRTSDTVVTITLDAFATYNITAQETITVTVPGTAVNGGSPIVATPTFTIRVAVALAGSLPAQTGTLTNKTTNKQLAGALGAFSGTIAAEFVGTPNVNLAGALGAFSASLAQKYIIALSGAQPAATGTIAVKTVNKQLAGELSATGTIAAQQSLFRSVEGSLPSQTGALTKKYLITLSGALGAFSGTIAAEFLVTEVSLAGALGPFSGTIAANFALAHVTVAGALPQQSGSLSVDITLRHVSLSGAMPSAAGSVAAHVVLAHIALAGALPTATGAIAVDIVFRQIALSGALGALTATLAGDFLTVLTGRPPRAGAGSLRVTMAGTGSFRRTPPGAGRVLR